jgi:uncharacterized membrane protein YdcZ (DUF606 family)
MRFFLLLCALAAGALLPMQAGINAQLKQHLGTPVQAVCVSVVVSAIALWLYLLIARVPLKMGRRLRCSSVTYRFRYAPSYRQSGSDRLAGGPF